MTRPNIHAISQTATTCEYVVTAQTKAPFINREQGGRVDK